MKLSLFPFLGLALLLSSFASSAEAASITVTTETDELNADGDCSLREAIRAANTDAVIDGCAAGSGADTITVPAGTYTLTLTGAGENAALTGDLDIDGGDLTINGAGAAGTVIDGNGTDRVFHTDPFGTGTFAMTFSGMTIRNGNPGAGNGGGIFKNSSTMTLSGVTVTGNTTTGLGCGIDSGGVGTLTLNSSTVSNNTGACINGAGITSGTALVLNNSTVSGNSTTAVAGVGGVMTTGANDLTLTDSAVSGNTASGAFGTGGVENSGVLAIVRSAVSGNSGGGNGGGIEFGGTTMTITNSTVSGNSASGDGGGLRFDGTTGSLNNVTMTLNTADSAMAGGSGGGGLYVNAGTLEIRNSIVAGNTDATGGQPDCSGTVASRGYNIIQDTSGCTIGGDTTGNINGTSPGLAALAANGGGTQTHLLQTGSPAIDAGNPSGCTDGTSALTNDQRGFSRPLPSGGRCDIGAVEVGCGNGVVETTEACDDGDGDDTDACLNSCVSAACGDGEVQADVEQCDDGSENSDTTADACRIDCTVARCGDSVVDTGEACDDGNTTAGDGCNETCEDEEEGGGGGGGGCSLVRT